MMGSLFPKATGDTSTKNNQGQIQLDNILSHPDSKITKWKHKTLGMLIDIELPGGGGARFSQNGKFIGFLEP